MEPLPLSILLTPKTLADQEKLAAAVRLLASEEFRFDVRPGQLPGSFLISTSTEKDLERVTDRLARQFGVEAAVGRPIVEYRETLTRSSEAQAKAKLPAARAYAHVAVRVRPRDAGSGNEISDATIGGCIPARFVPAVESAIRTAIDSGPVSGYPIVDIEVEVYDGSYHETDSTDDAFRAAAAEAFFAAVKKAEPILLEPAMEVIVRVEDTYAEGVIRDLLSRRGALASRRREPDQEVVTAHVPLSESLAYESSLRELTRGHAACSIRFLRYQALIQGPGDDDDRDTPVREPRRPPPRRPATATSVPEPDDAEPG